MKTLEEIKNSLIQQKEILTEKYKVNRVGIFGSYVRGEQTQKSDIDILIDYEEVPSLITLIELEHYLEKALNSEIDLVTRKGIKPQFKESILDEAVYI
jgi:predicted nucleotidyltransferase